jgi:molybdopterin-guanine dinucleotide biosynthesis protein A
VKIAAALLAGGESRRMGRDKALITFAGKPLWRRQLDLLRQLDPLEIFVSARTDPPWRPRDIHFTEDAEPSRGPLSGLAACLARTRAEHLLVLAVDMPFMSESYLRGLCREIVSRKGIIPIINDRSEPLAALYPQSSVSKFSDALHGDDFSLQTVARKLIASGILQPLTVMAEEIPLFRSVNEPGDLPSFPSDVA